MKEVPSISSFIYKTTSSFAFILSVSFYIRLCGTESRLITRSIGSCHSVRSSNQSTDCKRGAGHFFFLSADPDTHLIFIFVYLVLFRCGCILKSIEFPHLSSTVDDDDDDDDHEDIAKKSEKVPTSALAGGNKPLEVLLLERNKALQSENTALKVANSELQGKRFRLKFFYQNSLTFPDHQRIKLMFIHNHSYVCVCVSKLKVNVRPFFWPKKDSFRNLFVFLFLYC